MQVPRGGFGLAWQSTIGNGVGQFSVLITAHQGNACLVLERSMATLDALHCNPLPAIASILEKKAHAFAGLTLIMSDLQPGTRQKWPATEPASPHFTCPLRAGLAASERWRWSARPTAVCALPSS